MSIGPLLPGRIPDTFSVLQTQRNLRTAQGELSRLQRQITTGQRFFTPGEDPGAAAQTIKLQSLLERKTQAQQNTETDRSLLTASDDALGSIANTLIGARSVSLAAIGISATPAETEQFVTEIEAMLDSAVLAANGRFRGRHLFAGTLSADAPFAIGPQGVDFLGDDTAIDSRPDLGLTLANNVNSAAAFGQPVARSTIDLDPTLSAETSLASLNRGAGVDVDGVRITLGGATVDVDLAGSETIGDIQTRLEAAFAAGPATLTVGITATGLTLTPSAGTIEVANVDGSRTATDLGILSAPAATVASGDLDPAVDPLDPVASLFGGTLPASWADGLIVTEGSHSETLDLSTAVTVEDVINVFKLSDLNLDARIAADGQSLEVVSRSAGAGLTIGESTGTLAADLGLRTFTGATSLDELNDGLGVPIYPGAQPGTQVRDLNLVRRDGTEVAVDLKDATSIQDVLDAINAVDPGVLTAQLAPTGNGIWLEDNLAVAAPTVPVPFQVLDDAVAESLGLVGEEATGTGPIVGADVNPQRSDGIFSLLWQLRDAIQAGDDRHIGRVSNQLDGEIGRLNAVRGEVGQRLKVLDETEDRLGDETLRIQESISNVFDADLTETITRMYSVQAAYEASLQVSSTLLRTNLVSLL